MNEKDLVIIKEAYIYEKRRDFIVVLFTALILLPFGFSVYNYLNLKDCQSRESNGCPSLFVPTSSVDAVEPNNNLQTGKIQNNSK